MQGKRCHYYHYQHLQLVRVTCYEKGWSEENICQGWQIEDWASMKAMTENGYAEE
jgi:hypothetical protein